MVKANEFCRSLVLRYTAEWQQVIQRLGRWVDWDNQYRTMDTDFMESVWWVFKSLWDKDLIYEGYKSLAYCPRCATPLSNFEVNQGYRDTQDPSVVVRFALTGAENTSLLAWTTTPWTLPCNTGLAVNPAIEYARVRTRSGEEFILARELVETVFDRGEEEISAVEVQPVDALLGKRYEPLFDYFAALSDEGAFRVVAADFVSIEEGTGVVHIAPGFGEEDYQLGLRKGLPVVCPIDEDCCFTDEVADYAGGTGAENGDVESSARGLAQIKIADPSFDMEEFLEGAKTAFEMILDAFSKSDKKQLQNLLDSTTYQSFHDEIERRSHAGERLETTLVSIILADIADARMLQSTARVTIKIISEQVSVTRNELDEVVSGDPSRVETIKDLWCFARDTRSRDPNWELVETKPDDQ